MYKDPGVGLNLSIENGKQFLEGIPGQLPNVSGITPILEACLSNRVSRVLLYSDNLAQEFFDLSSGMAGEILQKFRNYGVRMAVVRSPGLQLSSKFGGVIAEESLGPYFRLFENRDTAQEWLCSE